MNKLERYHVYFQRDDGDFQLFRSYVNEKEMDRTRVHIQEKMNRPFSVEPASSGEPPLTVLAYHDSSFYQENKDQIDQIERENHERA